MAALAVVAITIGIVSSGFVAAAEPAETPAVLSNTMCPVMPEMEADAQHFIDHEGQRIYFCCPKCAPKFKQNPAAYAANLPDATTSLAATLRALPHAAPASDVTEGIPTGSDSPALTNTMCPVMPGDPVDPAIFVEHEGRRVYLCCDLCVSRFEANPARYAEELARVMPVLAPATDAESESASGGSADSGHDHPVTDAASDEQGHDNHDHAEHGHEAEADRVAGAGQTTSTTAGNDEHDHSAHEHGETTNPLLQFIHWLGRFHPPTVAFPIALLAAAGVAELLFMAKQRPIFDHASRFCAWFGIVMTVAGGVLGWFFAGFRLTDPTWLLTTHRWLGTTATLWTLLLILPTVKAWSDSGDVRRWRRGYRIALFVAILLVGTNAFFGGAMIYGLDHYQWP